MKNAIVISILHYTAVFKYISSPGSRGARGSRAPEGGDDMPRGPRIGFLLTAQARGAKGRARPGPDHAALPRCRN